MSSLAIGLIILACVFGGTLLGFLLRYLLPDHHLSKESQDAVKLGTGLISTMAALVLGLLVSSAKSAYDRQKDEVTEMSANVLRLDRTLEFYGPETQPIRAAMRKAVETFIGRLWHHTAPPAGANPLSVGGEAAYEGILQLQPTTPMQHKLQSQAESVMNDIGRTRLLLLQQSGSAISRPLLCTLVFWLTVIFISFGLFAPRNPTVLAALFLCAVAVSGALYLILEMDHPFDGLIQISEAPMRHALTLLGS